MFNLNDIMLAGQNGEAINNLARQFNIAPEQAQAAVEALMPAFAQGFQQNVVAQNGMGNLIAHMMSGQHASAFEQPGDINAETIGAGNDVLGELFGSKQVSRQVAAHAADISGVSQTVLKQMLPVIASMVMGGIMKSLQNQGLGGIFGQLGQLAGQGAFGNVLGQIFGQQAGAPPSQRTQPEAPQPQAGGLGDVLGGVLGGMLGGGQKGGAGGLGDILGGMLGGGQHQQAPSQQTPPPGTPSSLPGGLDPALVQAGLDAFGKMFNPGGKAGQAQQGGLNDVLSQIFANNRR